MMETFIHEEYVNKRREQRRMQHQQHHHHQQRRRRQMRSLQIETDKGKLMKLPASSPAEGQQSPREQHQPAAAYRSPVGSPTADAASFRDHLFDYLKPY
ncbi:unnamed protein product [Urochloa humidicola]